MLPFKHGIKLSKEQVPKNEHEEQFMSRVPYASTVGSLMYAMLCARPDICFAASIVSRFQSKPGPDHWTEVKHFQVSQENEKQYACTLGKGFDSRRVYKF